MISKTPEASSTDMLSQEGRALLHDALHGYDDLYGVGSMSNAVYDTAWVSLVTKTVDGAKQWLFPECFHFLLRTQLDDGGWESYASEVDGILNTAASLISLKRHAAEPLQIQDVPSGELEGRIARATGALDSMLAAWDVSSAAHVGFEIIVPALLEELEREGIAFNFRGRETLLKINAAKLSRFNPTFLYSTLKTTALHSLEAFIGKIDFDKVSHHKVHGAMMASPSSTAAYLMHASVWDDAAEDYLRHVVRRASSNGDGGVPSAYPSTYFELTWILSTLLKSGYTAADLDSRELDKAKEILAQVFEDEGGIIGFAPNTGADADDTAKGLLTLKMLDVNISPNQMVHHFEAKGHFRTYSSERDPSLSANCNVLVALLHMDDVSRYSAQILKCVRFICGCWWESDAAITDKWNLCYLYPSMLMVEAFVDLLSLTDKGQLSGLLDQETKSRLSVALCQATLRIMLQQLDDGSWDESPEQTSYAILTLVQARRVAFFEPIQTELDLAIERGREYIKFAQDVPPRALWIEKVSYTSPLLSKAYELAALKASAPQTAATTVGHDLASSSAAANAKLDKYVDFYRRTPLFSGVPRWQLRASVLEASLFLPLLRARHLDVFPRDGLEEERYLELIPFTWTGCNNRAGTFASASFLYDMMIVSLLNYQADEFMEAAAAPAFADDWDELRRRIEVLFNNNNAAAAMTTPNGNGHLGTTTTNGDDDVLGPLARFVSHVLAHPAVTAASPHDAAQVRRELRTFLLAHVAQAEDNARFVAEKSSSSSSSLTAPSSSSSSSSSLSDNASASSSSFTSPTASFFTWVRSTSADHTSCPYSFALVCAMLGSAAAAGGSGSGAKKNDNNTSKDCFPLVSQKYFASDLCRHLATMCRMYNDYGSVRRDRLEGNLNSVDFAEFGAGTGSTSAKAGGEQQKQQRDVAGDDDDDDEEEAKKALFGLAEYERECLGTALARLQQAGGAGGSGGGWQRKMAVMRLFCDVTDLYGQIYVVRDMGTRMVQQQEQENGDGA
ncbi:ent-kaurene synthase [Diplodia corticola]|uniref:Ent-kaurene synthase n=1 Tax=Diplodia corticola TaxID=236234 RepID=A0A1J9RV27_9PEZI|nr:ent-kaurene synthase [Diplodia corticola]OJD36443.1 ent-kaurene synthase [Diplodia corticola]